MELHIKTLYQDWLRGGNRDFIVKRDLQTIVDNRNPKIGSYLYAFKFLEQYRTK